MRKHVSEILFFIAAAACLWSVKANAQEVKPVAECKDGKCVMSEEDFKRLQDFIAAVVKAKEYNDGADDAMDERVTNLTRRALSCEAQLKLRKAKR